MRSECLENMLDEVNKKTEDPECGSISNIIEQVRKEEGKIRSSFYIKEVRVCRLNHNVHAKFRNCPHEWIKEGKMFDCFVLVKLYKNKSICLHVECKSRKNFNVILKKLKEKISGYVYKDQCFCFNATPKTVAVVIIKNKVGKKERYEKEIKRVGFDYAIIQGGAR
ncbi:hypothetical protein [Candidatus Methanodesulfokora washburnensis]|uniref:Uncharacterized protein n=1 Tax=Candidatus Methanodesulfokora washburnensis TaxID=2478471 RepID=A0A429GJB0_9CREN|nr:hypothetical protein [Candidatus Methanodesulfokores washburnensis]RSN73934.1 hypothetical protein D6D85_09130 [Candidatus Methanodesulfokores washburnensis]